MYMFTQIHRTDYSTEISQAFTTNQDKKKVTSWFPSVWDEPSNKSSLFFCRPLSRLLRLKINVLMLNQLRDQNVVKNSSQMLQVMTIVHSLVWGSYSHNFKTDRHYNCPVIINYHGTIPQMTNPRGRTSFFLGLFCTRTSWLATTLKCIFRLLFRYLTRGQSISGELTWHPRMRYEVEAGI